MTEATIQEERRRYINCGSDKTRDQKNGSKQWHRSKAPLLEGFWLCHNCYTRIFTHPILSKRRLRIGSRHYYLDHAPRSGICSECGRSISEGEIRRTNLCLLGIKNPKKNFSEAKEYCIRCHKKIHARVKEILAAYYDESAA